MSPNFAVDPLMKVLMLFPELIDLLHLSIVSLVERPSLGPISMHAAHESLGEGLVLVLKSLDLALDSLDEDFILFHELLDLLDLDIGAPCEL